MKNCIEQIYNKKQINKQMFVFLDRDGTLIKDVGYLHNTSQIKLLPGVIKGLKLLQSKGAVFIIITNQPVIAKGLATVKKVKEINDNLVALLKKHEIIIQAVYFCPHHPHADIEKYRIECFCRKPGIGMFNKAINRFSVDITKSVMVGDHERDINAGKKLGISTYYITKNPPALSNIASLSNSEYTNFLSVAKSIAKSFL